MSTIIRGLAMECSAMLMQMRAISERRDYVRSWTLLHCKAYVLRVAALRGIAREYSSSECACHASCAAENACRLVQIDSDPIARDEAPGDWWCSAARSHLKAVRLICACGRECCGRGNLHSLSHHHSFLRRANLC